jgi:type II secretory pathway pseudopilin PulG
MLRLFKTHPDQARRRYRRDSGHLLLAILLVMALMVIAATYEAPRIVQQLKRDREEEMIHRGTEYARAIKKYYKKFGSYPSTIEQLENTNNIRFLRKRYKDPLTKDGKWTLLHYTDVAATLGQGGGPGTPAALLGTQGQQGLGTPAGQQGSSRFGSSTFGSSNPSTLGGFGTSNFGNNQPTGNSQGTVFSQQQALSGQQGTTSSTFGSSNAQSATGDSGSSTTSGSTFSNSPSGSTFGNNNSTTPGGGTNNPNSPSTTLGNQQGLGGQTFGAGAIIGVGSKSKDPTIRIYNKKKTYDEWQFIYNPIMDQANMLLKGPYSPSAFVGGSNIGAPAGQQNQQQGPFGQQGGPGGQQPGGYGNQQTGGPNTTLTPSGGQFPPDQNH